MDNIGKCHNEGAYESSERQPNPAEPLAVVTSGSQKHLHICSLVLTAKGFPHYFPAGNTQLLVDPQDLEAAKEQLEIYFIENRNWPPPRLSPEETSAFKAENPPTVLIMGAMAIFFSMTGPWEQQNPWFQIGAVNSRAILENHEWWRLTTALTLHADDAHLVGNCIIGGFMVHLLCRTIGFGTGWAGLILTGFCGNFLNVALRGAEHNSVGFSTAIFGAIGIFSGLRLFRKSTDTTNLRELLVPLGAGIGLLALLGSAGERTDLGAHFLGLLCGVIAGVWIRKIKLPGLAHYHNRQYLIFSITLFFVICCWLLAWQNLPGSPP